MGIDDKFIDHAFGYGSHAFEHGYYEFGDSTGSCKFSHHNYSELGNGDFPFYVFSGVTSHINANGACVSFGRYGI